MGREQTMVCERCGSGWDARSRFCGRCGQTLAEDDATRPEHAAARRRWLVVVGVLVGVVALFAGVVIGLADLTPPHAGGDPAVSLPDAEEVEGDQGLDPEERDAALVPFDPDRTVCAPVGCEVWRRPLGGRPSIPPGVVGSPVVIEDDLLVRLDLETGEVRWWLPIEDDLRAREGGPVDLSPGRAMLADNDEVVVLANTHGVQLVSQAGETRWARSLPAESAHLAWVHVTGTSVVVVHESPPALTDVEDIGSGDELPLVVAITVLDTRDGQLRWSRGDSTRFFTLPTLADQLGLLLLGSDDGTISALDLVSGEPRYDLMAGPGLWPDYAGGVITLLELSGGTAVNSRVFDASDGALRMELPGSARTLLEMDGRVIVLLERGGDGSEGASPEAVAVDPDGSIGWRHALEPGDDDRCCPSMLDLDRGWVRISAGPGATALVVEAFSGFLRTDDPLEAAATSSVRTQFQLGRRLLVEHPDQQDDPGYVLRDSSGRSLTISGPGRWLGPMGGPSAEIILLASSQELVAVRFP